MTRPVVTSVSQATRPSGSPPRMASRTASEIWSASLSGCPSVTDSEVKRYRALIRRILAAAPDTTGPCFPLRYRSVRSADVGRVVAVAFAAAVLGNSVMLFVTPQLLTRRAKEGARQRRERGYRVDFFRPYLWILESWPRRIAWMLLNLAFA